MKKNRESSGKLSDWGVSLLNKLPSRSRKRRKRDADKRRRRLGKAETQVQTPEE